MTPSTSLIAPEIVTALAELKAEIAVDARLRSVETSLAAMQATIQAGNRPPVWPAVLSSVVAVVSAVVALAALLTTR